MSSIRDTPVFTPGQLAARIGVPLSRVNYVLQTRNGIEPVGRAGIIRLYDAAAVDRVREELDAIAEQRRVVRAQH